MNTWQQLVNEFRKLQARVDALESRPHAPTFSPPPFLAEPEPIVRRGRPRKNLEGEDVI